VFEFYSIVCDHTLLFRFQFFQFYRWAARNMATFHVNGCLDLTIMVDKLGMMFVFDHCLCVMFVFQPSSLYISMDVLYDFNDLVSSLLYHIPTTSSQGHRWVVNCGQYRIVGDNLSHNVQDIILMLRITSFIVKIVKDKHEVLNIFLQCLNAPTFSIFIELLIPLQVTT
jgi:hypothetical protein